MAAAERLGDLGYGLLLAHPERTAFFLEDGWERLQELRAAGRCSRSTSARCSATTASRVQQTAVALVRAGLAFCLASDGHPGSREHTLQLGFHLLLRAGASSPGPAYPGQPAAAATRGRPSLTGRESLAA